jgi:hypothetical protein
MSLWYGIKSALAKYNGDLETSEREWECMKDTIGVDNLIRTFVSAATGVLLAQFGAALAGTGFLGFLVPCIVYFLAQWMVDYLIAQKNHCGGWSYWFASLFMPYRGPKMWAGGIFDAYESQITEELICPIGLTIV